MNSVWKLRMAAVLGLCLAIASAVVLRPAEVAVIGTASADEPDKTKPAIRRTNTGKKPDGAFLVDLKAGFDGETQYLSEYEMDTEWIKIAFRPGNVRFGKDGMTLELSRTRGKLPFAGAEFQRSGFYGYGRYEAVLKASEGSGAVSSFFTHTDSYFDDPHDEIDFEFVARSPRQVHLNYFHKGESDPVDIPLWFDTAMADHLYAFEWTPESIRWFVDGHMIREVLAGRDGPGIPTTSGRVLANLWAGSGSATGWTGEPMFQRTSAAYRCISHVPMGKGGSQCSDTFKAPPKP